MSDGEPTFALIGDSHALVVPAFDQAAKEGRQAGVVIATSSVPPVPGIWKPSFDPGGQHSFARNKAVQGYLLGRNIDHVIIVARWSSMICGYSDAQVDHRNVRKEDCMINGDSPSTTLRDALNDFTQRLAANGVRVTIVCQTPETDRCSAARDFLRNELYPLVNEAPDTEWYSARGKAEAKVLGLITNAVVHRPVVDSAFGDRSLYRDSNHLSFSGSQEIMFPTAREIFELR